MNAWVPFMFLPPSQCGKAVAATRQHWEAVKVRAAATSEVPMWSSIYKPHSPL